MQAFTHQFTTETITAITPTTLT